MLWSVVLLLASAFSVESYRPSDTRERLNHGRQLKIYLPKNSDRLEFTPADHTKRTTVYWEKGRSISHSRGRVYGSGGDRRWVLDMVTYEDQGTYTQTDYWNKEVSTVSVAVTPRRNFVKRVAGESLFVTLEGIDVNDATLIFSSDNHNVTLVRDGAVVSQDLPDYWNRVRTHSTKIEIKNVNISDEGHYTVMDRKDRVVSVTRMDLTDQHDSTEGNPLLALLLLLGIPAGVCCCCRKKIFKKKAAANVQNTMTSPEAIHPPPAGPVGPCPPYNTPGQPGTMYYQNNPNSNLGPSVYPPPAGPQWNGPPPSPGFNPSYPPANTSYNPAAPMIPPGQPPQWSGPPQGPYPPAGPTTPMGYYPAPVMYSSAPPEANSQTVDEGVKMASPPAEQPAATTATPESEAASLPVAPVPPSSTTGQATGDNAFQFQIDGGKNSTNFL